MFSFFGKKHIFFSLLLVGSFFLFGSSMHAHAQTFPIDEGDAQCDPVGGVCKSACDLAIEDHHVAGCEQASLFCCVSKTPSGGDDASNPTNGSGGQSGTGSSQGNCGAGFESVAGICIPITTGLPGSDDSSANLANPIIAFMQWLLGIFAFLAVIAFVISGIMYLTSAGNESQIEKAKKGMIYAIIGVVVALSGFIIILFINGLLGGGSATSL